MQDSPVFASCTPQVDLRHISFQGVGQSEVGRLSRVRKDSEGADRTAVSFAGSVLRRSGLDPSDYLERPLQRRVAACLRALGARTVGEAERMLASRPALDAVATDALLMGVTEFFRDPEIFTVLEHSVLPTLLTSPRTIRIWSAGASTGAELYSVAILLAEAGALERAELVGTDCRPTALARAAGGYFTRDALAGLSVSRRDRYFEPVADECYRVVEPIRTRLSWRCANLCEACLPGPFDLILCRNVSIYLRPSAAATVFGLIEGAMAVNGYLVVGRAERPRLSTARLVGRALYRRTL